MASKTIGFSSMDRNDPQPPTWRMPNNIIITVKGVPETVSSAFRTLVNERYSRLRATVAEFHRLHDG